MYIRCSSCHTSLWIQSLSAVGPQDAKCDQCGQRYQLGQVEHLGDTRAEQHKCALQFARENDIDLPGSYSVLLGIMSLEHALELAGARTTPPKPERPAATAVAPITVTFDEDFTEAVDLGFLTPGQAIERGNREEHAKRLAARHRLPMELAYAVTDNRISLLGAVRQRPPDEPIRTSPARETAGGSGFLRLLAAAAAVLLVAYGVIGWRPSDGGAEGRAAEQARTSEIRRLADDTLSRPANQPHAALRAATEMLTDDGGQTVKVVGPDPSTVLVALCDSGDMAGRMEPLHVAPTIPAAPRARLGIIMDREDPDTLYSVTIRQDRTTDRWIAGDGSRPVAIVPVPEQLLGVLEASLQLD